MDRLAYPPAHAVAHTVAEHFRHHVERTGIKADIPDATTIERIINAAFWASLRREEGRAPTISLAYLPPGGTGLFVERPLALEPTTLTKLAPAVERPGIHLGVWKNGDGESLSVWGATRAIPPLCFVVEVIEPGLLVIKHRRADPDGKFANVAVLEGDQIKVVDAEGTMASECPEFVSMLLGFTTDRPDNVLLPLALSMRAHKHGGSLLVVPHDSQEWRKSIVSVPYAVTPPFTKLREGANKEAIDAIGGLTAVDGAVVISNRWDVLAFGAKIGRTETGPFVEEVLVREPILGHTPLKTHVSELGGTRHLSAAQFVHEQRDALALVASQDGRFTVFGWSRRAQMVHAYRVEALLL
jgi:sensor domain DACNV-containing protein